MNKVVLQYKNWLIIGVLIVTAGAFAYALHTSFNKPTKAEALQAIIDKDYNKALSGFQKLYLSGDKSAGYYLYNLISGPSHYGKEIKGFISKEEKAKACKYLISAVEANYTKAQFELASQLGGLSSDCLKPQNAEEERFKLLTKASEQGYIPAQESLGIIYEGKKDFEKAKYWWRKAGDAGSADGQYMLAKQLLAESEQDKSKIQEAIKYFKLSAVKREKKDYPTWREEVEFAMNEGVGLASSEFLGFIYGFGYLVEQNTDESIKYFNKSINTDLKNKENAERLIKLSFVFKGGYSNIDTNVVSPESRYLFNLSMLIPNLIGKNGMELIQNKSNPELAYLLLSKASDLGSTKAIYLQAMMNINHGAVVAKVNA